jgi:hypothetical protein
MLRLLKHDRYFLRIKGFFENGHLLILSSNISIVHHTKILSAKQKAAST